MPEYQFECKECGKVTDAFFRIADKPDSINCVCGGVAKKIMSSPMVLGDDMPAWMRHPEVLGCLQCYGDKNKIRTRSDYNRYLKNHPNIAETSAKREV